MLTIESTRRVGRWLLGPTVLILGTLRPKSITTLRIIISRRPQVGITHRRIGLMTHPILSLRPLTTELLASTLLKKLRPLILPLIILNIFIFLFLYMLHIHNQSRDVYVFYQLCRLNLEDQHTRQSQRKLIHSTPHAKNHFIRIPRQRMEFLGILLDRHPTLPQIHKLFYFYFHQLLRKEAA